MKNKYTFVYNCTSSAGRLLVHVDLSQDKLKYNLDKYKYYKLKKYIYTK